MQNADKTTIEQNNLPQELVGLNPPQLEAVKHFQGPILVLAGAGSGKTRVLTRRVAHLVKHHKIAPDKILAVTFTNKATQEMKSRLAAALGYLSEYLWISTFHATAVKILRRHASKFNFPQDFSIYDDQDSRSLLKETIKFLEFDPKEVTVDDCRRKIDWAKNNFISAELFAENKDSKNYDPDVAQVYQEYQQRLFHAKAMDFGDLLFNCAKLLEEHADIRALYQKQFEFILVDEFQDTNKVQYSILMNLLGQHQNILVVGDDDQSIYGFRGANINNLLQFEQDFPTAHLIKLEQNYRSTANILEAAHAVIEKNTERKEKKLWTESEHGPAICCYLASDESDEANFIVEKISEHLAAGIKPSEVAIFYRIHAQSRALEEALMSAGLDFVIYGGQKFYDRKEIKDIIAYLRLLINPADNQAFLRVVNVPARGIGAQTIASTFELAQARQQSLLEAAASSSNKKLVAFSEMIKELQERAAKVYLSALVEDVMVKTQYLDKLKKSKDENSESRLENLRELKAIAKQMENSALNPWEILRAFLDRCALSFSDDLPEEEAKQQEGAAVKNDRISLMTLHLAKGLEFPIVFLTGMEDGLLPHYRSKLEKHGAAEERRLCYVGMTRAMQKLYLTRTVTRGMFSSGGSFGNSGYFREASPFLHDIPTAYLEQVSSQEINSAYGQEFETSSSDDDCDYDPYESEPQNRWGYRKKTKAPKKKSDYLRHVFSAEDLE